MKSLLGLALFFLMTENSFGNDFSKFIQYGAGYYGSVYFHEVGHATAAKLGGASEIFIEIPGKNGNIFGGVTHYLNSPKNNSEGFRQAVNLAGLVFGNAASEFVIQKPGLHGNPFAQSIASSAQIINLANVYRYYGRVRGVNGWNGNDIDRFEIDGGNPHILSAVLVGYTLWSLKRMSKKSIPLYSINLKF
ncbi:MAG: hypothetical protein H7240_11445 [Glaciimonas sp.]|nr:hypothetical protein [Glaciimonas sp.]